MLSGMTTEIAAEVKVNEVMIQNVTEDVYLLADRTKSEKTAALQVRRSGNQAFDRR